MRGTGQTLQAEGAVAISPPHQGFLAGMPSAKRVILAVLYAIVIGCVLLVVAVLFLVMLERFR